MANDGKRYATGQEEWQMCRLFVMSNEPYHEKYDPFRGIVILRGTPSEASACGQWAPLFRQLRAAGCSARELYVLDFSDLSQHLPLETASPGLGPVSKPVYRLLQKLNLQNATLVALSTSCELAIKILTHEGSTLHFENAIFCLPKRPTRLIKQSERIPSSIYARILGSSAQGPEGPVVGLFQEMFESAESVFGCPSDRPSLMKFLAKNITEALERNQELQDIAAHQVHTMGWEAVAETAPIVYSELVFSLSPMTKQLVQEVVRMKEPLK